MGTEPRNHEDLLLDWHLNRLDDEQRLWVAAELDRDETFRTKSERLQRVLEPLDDWRVAPGSARLADSVLAAIENTKEVAPVMASATRGWTIPWPFPRMRGFAAVAACLLLLLGVFVPGISELKHRSQRAMCSNNLRSIFTGTAAYQHSYAGSLPFAGSVAGASWLPGCRDATSYASNSRHPFLLVKLNLGPTTKDFICASVPEAQAMTNTDVKVLQDFRVSRNVSYDSLNLASSNPNLRPPTAIAYLSDHNPLFVGGKFNASVDAETANSPAHRGRGQSVLSLDGTVEYVRTPYYGMRRDNLWLMGTLRKYRGTESPTARDDAFLIPGYPITDPLVCKKLKR